MNNIYHAKTSRASPYDSDIYLQSYGSPSTNTGPSYEASELSSPTQICLSLESIFSEENHYQDFDSIDLLSPNSKASSLLSRSKRIEKRPIVKKEASKPKAAAKKPPSKGPQKRTAWTPEEDEHLLSLFKVYGAHWAQIASHIPNRTGKQVRDRYMAVLVANIKRDPWTDEEDRAILVMVEKIGPQWSKIAESLKGRAEIQVKNRYYTYLKKYGIELSDEDRFNVNSVEATTEASPKGFDPTDMISYESENVNAGDLFFEWKKLGLDF